VTASLFFSGAAVAMAEGATIPADLEAISFAELAGWVDDDQRGLARFLRLWDAARRCTETFAALPKTIATRCARRPKRQRSALVFRNPFQPYRVREPGFVTGYFEPELAGLARADAEFDVSASEKTGRSRSVPADGRPHGWPDHLSTWPPDEGTLTEMPDRGAIMDGALDAEKLELVWLNVRSTPTWSMFRARPGFASLTARSCGSGTPARPAIPTPESPACW
jgi:membrane-bound lytic murein transglycosylase A